MDPAVGVLIRLSAAIGVSVLLSLILGRWVLRLDRRGAGVLGGVCAGLALGPAVFGSLAPGVYADWMMGGVKPAMEAARLTARIEPERAALGASGVSSVAVAEHVGELEQRAEALKREAERDRAMRRQAAGAAAASCALLAGLAVSRPVRPRWPAVGAGAVGGLLSCLGFAVAARAALGLSIAEACAAGAVMTGGVLAWNGSSGARSFGFGALAIACAGLCVFAGVWTGAMLACVIGLGLAIRSVDFGVASGRWARAFAEGVLVPTSAALVLPLAGTDVTLGGAVLIAGACLLAGDLQLIGSWIGVNLFESGVARSRPLSAWLVRFGRGAPGWQMLLLGLAVGGLGFDPSTAGGAAVVYAVAGAAVTSELTRPGAMRALHWHRRVSEGLD